MDRVSVLIVGLCLAVVVSGEGQRIPAEIGQSVTLPCETKELPCVKVEWIRHEEDIKFNVKSKDVKLPEDAPECYKGRVELKDPQNGDVSLVLKNVMAEDNGTYECYVEKESNPSNTEPKKPISTIYLDVLPPPDEIISAEIGENVTLPCETKEYKVVKWSRPGVEAESIILTDKNSYPEVAPGCYQGRVELKDPQNGDVSLILKNVTAEDKGRYECIGRKPSNRSKRSNYDQPISTVYLDVRLPPPPHVPPPSGRGNIGLIVGLLAVVALIAAVVVAAFLVKKKQKSPPPDKEAEKPLQIPPAAADPSIP